MKHRSVIAFVIVAAALFSLPQLSHDLQALKGAVGTRLHRELLNTFLSLPSGEPVAVAAPTESPAEMLLASCPKEKSSATVAKSGKVAGRANGKSFEQSAMIGDPANDPINQRASVEIKDVIGKAIQSLPEAKVETEVAMIIPPESGVDPRAVASAFASSDAAREEAKQSRVEAEGMRVAYVTSARFEAQNAEWQRVNEEVVRKLGASFPAAYEFRVVRDGAKTKVLKFKCGDCPATAPRLPRAPRQIAVDFLVPSPVVSLQSASE